MLYILPCLNYGQKMMVLVIHLVLVIQLDFLASLEMLVIQLDFLASLEMLVIQLDFLASLEMLKDMNMYINSIQCIF